MPKAPFTYEIRRLPEEAAGLEDYVVRGRDGSSLGTVAGLLERGGELMVVVESGLPPLSHARRVVSWGDVDDVDHEALAVWTRLDEAGFERRAELDPDAARAAGEGAEATRVTELPRDVAARPEVAPGGPVDRPPVFVAVGLVLAATFSALVVMAVATAWDSNWWAAALVVPLALGLAALVVALRAWRDPYERRGAEKP